MDRQILEPAFSSTFKKLPDISTHVEIQLCCDISEWVINDRAINLTLALSFQERPKYELWIIYICFYLLDRKFTHLLYASKSAVTCGSHLGNFILSKLLPYEHVQCQ